MRWFIPFVLLISATAQTVRVSFEGQPVSAVDLIANPHRDVEPLRPLVQQLPGQPYSEDKVRASVVALTKAGNFQKVDVKVSPEPSGLRLDFVLEPAYYVGVIEFPETSRYFSYSRLLQVANFSDEDPYSRTRASRAATALTRFLQRNGYFQAETRLEERIDDSNQLVTVVYHVQMGKQARIGQIDIQGPPRPEADHLLHSVRSLRARLSGVLLKPGKSYTPDRIRKAIAYMKSSLAKQHHLANRVHENPPQYHADTNRVDVSFKVEEGPKVSIRTNGARLTVVPFLSAPQLKKLVPVYSEGTIGRELVDEGEQNLVDYFQKKGYFDVKVNTAFEREGSQISLVYQIEKGTKHRVERITFRGNHHLSSSALTSSLAIKKAHFLSRGLLSQKLLAKSVRNLEGMYRDTGFENAKVTSQIAEHGGNIQVTFEVAEGQQTLVENMEVQGNQAIAYDQLTAPKGFQVVPGGPYSPRRVSDDRSRIVATYLDRGYLNADVKPVVTRSPGDPNKVSVVYNITENQRVRVDQVVYLGQKHTRVSLIRDTAELPPESPLSETRALEAESRLYDLAIFDWASVGPRKVISTQQDEEVLIKVHEAKRNEITYGFGLEIARRGGNVPTGTIAVPGGPPVDIGNQGIAASESTFVSPRGSIEYTRRNIRGLGETGAISLLLSRLDQRALATYTDPHFRGTNWNALTSFSAERTTENPLFAASLGDVSFQLERMLNRKTNTRLQLRYDFNKTILSQLLVPQLVQPEDTHVRLSTISGTLIRDTRDKPLDAHHGSFTTFDLGITPGALGSSADFGRLFGQYAIYKPVGPVIWANSVRVGFVKSFAGSFVPTSQLFFSGGGTTLRGFPINEAGPQRIVPFCNVLTGATGCVNVTVPVGGRALFVLNSELRFPLGIMKNLGGVVFYDGGNVYSAINLHNFVDNYTSTVGLGLRYTTPVGPIRIDIGRNLNPVTGIKATQFFITLGQAF